MTNGQDRFQLAKKVDKYLIRANHLKQVINNTILMNEIVKEKLSYINKFSFLGYNPPYEVMNRRNEVVVELINYK